MKDVQKYLNIKHVLQACRKAEKKAETRCSQLPAVDIDGLLKEKKV